MTVYLRSGLFLIWFVVVSVTMNVGSLPLLVFPRRYTVRAARTWARALLWGLKSIVGLGVEVRGHIDSGRAVLVAAKHYSMWETVAFLALLPDPAIVIKRELLWVPLYGWYCWKMGMISVNRGAGSRAVRAMQRAAKRALSESRPLVIFPEGTRKAPGAPPDYKPGVAGLYALLGIPCVPVAHNSGLYWEGWFLRRPGTVVVEYLEPIPPGLERREFMAILQLRIEGAATQLLAEGRATGADGRRD